MPLHCVLSTCLLEEACMIVFEHHERAGQRGRLQIPLDDLVSKPRIIIRRRSRVNPIVVLSLFSAALLYDAISSPIARSIWGELSRHPTGFPLAVGIAAVLGREPINLPRRRFAKSGLPGRRTKSCSAAQRNDAMGQQRPLRVHSWLSSAGCRGVLVVAI